MKQTGLVSIALPRRVPKTILAVHRWHKRLLWDCVRLEFTKKTIEAALARLNEEFARYSRHVRDAAGLEGIAKRVLQELNGLKRNLSADLDAVRHATAVAHDTNEFMIGNLIVAHGGRHAVETVQRQPALKGTNLLHGDGWLLELLCAEHLEKKGMVGFVTFGTIFDPAGLDLIAFSRSRRRIRWKLRWPRRRRRRGQAATGSPRAARERRAPAGPKRRHGDAPRG